MHKYGKSQIIELLKHADILSIFILFCLFVVSVFCIAIIIYKFFYLKHQKIKLLQLLKKVKATYSINEFMPLSKEFHDNVGGRFLKRNLHDLRIILKQNEQNKLSLHDLNHLELILNQSLEHGILEEERYISVLGISAAVSPLVGLFGTVWGLIHAFISISIEQTTDITVVAPGIAQALMTTLAGLIVAIPALIFFNYFTNQIRKIEHYLFSLSDSFLAQIQRSFSN